MSDATFNSPLTAPPPAGIDPSAPYEPLAALRDLHAPPATSLLDTLLQPSPAVWAALGVLVVLAAIAALIEWRRRQTLGYQAIRTLKLIARDEARYGDARAVAAEASQLMRRILVSQTGRRASAALVGDDWRRFLSEGKAGLPAELGAFVAEAPYLPAGLPDAERVARAAVVAGVTRWIRGNT